MGDSRATVFAGADWPARRPRYTIVQVSDPHVPADGFLFDRVDACARVQTSVEMIAAAGCAPDVLVLSGDVADHGEAEAYVRLRPVIEAALQWFGAKLLVAPGNHDDVALLRAHLLGREPECGPLDEVVRVGGLRLIGLDSSVPDEVHGALTDDQLEALAEELAEPAADGTVLVVHHPPIWSTTPMSELVALREPQRLAEVIRGRDVRLILSGHTHRVSAGTLAGVPVWVSPATGSHADVLALNGFRGHAGGGFTRIDILGDGEIVATFVPLTGRDEILYEVDAPTIPGAQLLQTRATAD
ncbi:MAG TPA: metallophosphoesterase [Solirubrobacteraceae bacterium]|nr:metallophosphoesterase [Solirubrobacteraceae bacterium]